MLVILQIVIVAVSVLVGIGSVYVFKMKPDNQIEEIAEEVIEHQTGVDIDLSPDTPEEKPAMQQEQEKPVVESKGVK